MLHGKISLFPGKTYFFPHKIQPVLILCSRRVISQFFCDEVWMLKKKSNFLNGWWDAEDIFIKFLSTITKFPHIFLGRKCEAGWEQRGSANKKCVACPPGMYRPQADHLCQLCPKGQIKSEWIYEIINSPKKWTHKFEGFLPWEFL